VTDATTTVDTLSFEEALAELEKIVGRLESGQGSLDDAIMAYERGSELKKHCQKKLDEARMKVEKIRLPESGGQAETSEFES
jgi:exodeoxyribonuclease VII small subunit